MQTTLTPVTQDLTDAQREIELRSSQDGYNRYVKQQNSTETALGGHATSEAVKIIRGSIPLVSARITDWIASHDSRGRGKRPAGLAILRTFDPDLLAFLSINCVFSGITREHSVTAVQTAIGNQIEAEMLAKLVTDTKGAKTAARIRDKVAAHGSARGRHKVFKKLIDDNLPDDHDDNDSRLTQEDKVRIAEPLVNAVLQALPDMFELEAKTTGKNCREVVIRLTDAGVQMFADLREGMAWMQPIHRPMVVPPRPWTAFDTGCYYEARSARTVPLVRTFNKDHKRILRQAIDSGQMAYVLDAVNAIQSTEWAINTPILDLIKWCFDNGVSGVGLPPNKLMDIPQRYPDAVWQTMSAKDRKGHRINLAGVHERNRGIVADQAVLLRDIETAEELSRYQSFWLPHNLDFRGRVYPVPHFNHQRSDAIKALFKFSKGEPLGPYGIGWLSVHLANCGDFNKVSKASFDERIQWVEDNEDMILSVGMNPKATVDQWSQADSPFMFVAACMEYAAWVVSGRSEDFVSHLAVALDGSNSGLQHYAAALRSKDEAALVSLMPCDKPSDLYQTIADKVTVIAKQDAAEGNELAQRCLDVGITRSLVKRNVMTFAYSSEQFGFRQQLMDDTMRPINDDVFTGKIDQNPYAMPRDTGELDGGFQASGYLAARVWQAVTQTVTKATQGMEFFKRVSAVLAHEKQPLIWTTPLGMPVMHKYSVWETKRVSLFLYDRALPVTGTAAEDDAGAMRQVRLNIRTKPTDVIDKNKARSAVAPNVIHSMDGSHLMLTVLNANYEGFKDFALIHDSFGVHAGKTHRFFQIIRESFAEMYNDYCPFEEVYDYAINHLTDAGIAKLPPLPTKGDMDLQAVLDADYAFA